MKIKFILKTLMIVLLATNFIADVSAEDVVDKTGILTVEIDLVVPDDTTLSDTTWTVNIVPVTITEKSTINGYDLYSGIPLDQPQQVFTIAGGMAEERIGVSESFYGYITLAQIDFNTVKFDKAGVYRYELTEVKGNYAAVTYDETKYYLNVFVAYNDQDQLAVQYITGLDVSGEKASPKFINTVISGSFEVSKQVTGNLSEKNRAFGFNVEVESSELAIKDTALKGYYTKADGSTEEVTVTVGNTFDFTLKSGESLVLPSLPVGTVVKTTETSANQFNYTTTAIDKTTNSVLDSLNITGIVTADGLSYQFVNDKSKNTPNTGISDSSSLFTVILVLAVIGVALLVQLKLRNHDSE